MKLSGQNVALRFNRAFRNILTIVVVLKLFGAKADETTLPIGDAPASFPPTIPSLESDDAYVTYFYHFSGTGYWLPTYSPPAAGDIAIYQTQWAAEDTVHYKTNSAVVETDRGGRLYSLL